MTLSPFLLLALAPAPCAPTDLACTAREKAREARTATDPHERVQALLSSARARLALYRKTGSPAELCEARDLVRRLPRGQTGDLGDLPETTRAEVEAKLALLGHDCKPRSRRPTPTTTAPMLTSHPREETTPPPVPSGAPASPITSDPLEPVAASPSREETDRNAQIDVDRQQTEAPHPVAPPGPPRSSAPPEPDGPVAPPGAPSPALPRAGRGLLIAGGVLAGGAMIPGGLLAFAGARGERLASQQNALAAETHEQGFTTPDMKADSQALAAEVARWQRVMIGASITSAALGGVAVALITAGAVKQRRAARVAVSPGSPGFLLCARF